MPWPRRRGQPRISPRCVAILLAALSCRPRPAPQKRSDQAALAPSTVEAAPEAPPAPVDVAGVHLFVSPRAPVAGRPLRVVATSERRIDGELSITENEGADCPRSTDRHGGPPFFWVTEVASAAPGSVRAVFKSGSAITSVDVQVRASADPPRPPRGGGVWSSPASWDRAAEMLYSAWVEELFDAPTGQDLAFAALHEALRDPARNFLHDHLGEGEDDADARSLPIAPDCADLPYFLRAYFAWKLGLPFGFSSCTRGSAAAPPRCRRWHSNLEPAPARSKQADTFVDFLRVKLADTVHSGTGRSPATDDAGDYYPVPLTFESLRPGTIFADPYGHVLVIAKRVLGSEGRAGILYAVDGQPDGTVSRRRFWRGNFLFALDAAFGSPGWKRFRPVVHDPQRGARPLSNREIMEAPDYGDFSLAAYERGVEGFYDAMDDLLSPARLDPEQALLATLDALEEQVRGRVLSVANAKRHFDGHDVGGSRIEMPDGAAIFETTGPWEDFSTPSRDLRLLIAIDVARGFPERVARRPDRFLVPDGGAISQADLTARLASELGARRFAYERSDGSSFSLSLADLVARAPDLELAYNPNDCPELRWGAPPASAEASTCVRHAPAGQRAKMVRYRPWFRDRKRPPRG